MLLAVGSADLGTVRYGDCDADCDGESVWSGREFSDFGGVVLGAGTGLRSGNNPIGMSSSSSSDVSEVSESSEAYESLSDVVSEAVEGWYSCLSGDDARLCGL